MCVCVFVCEVRYLFSSCHSPSVLCSVMIAVAVSLLPRSAITIIAIVVAVPTTSASLPAAVIIRPLIAVGLLMMMMVSVIVVAVVGI